MLCGFREIRRSNSGNSCRLVLCNLRVIGAKADVSSAASGPVERQEAAACEDAVDDGLGEVASCRTCPRQVVDEGGGRSEAGIEAVLDGAVRHRDRQVRLSAARLARQDQATAVGRAREKSRGG